MKLISLLAAAGLAYAAYTLLSDRHADESPRKRLVPPGGTGAGDGNTVRAAGQEIPRPTSNAGATSTDWDEVDEASDESFPASDPPARY
jgi:hypothetical protein